MADYIEQGEVKQLIVQRKDGSTWTAEIGLDGRLRLLEKIYDPSAQTRDAEKDEQTKQQLEAEQKKAEDEAKAEAAEQAEEAEQAAQQAAETAWGEEAKPAEDKIQSDKDLNQYIQSLQHRGSSEKLNRQKQPDRKLNDQYYKKLKDPAFLARLNSIMLDNKYSRRLRGRTRGKLDMSRLFKVPTGARSVFTQKQNRKGKLYNVVITVDQSGSMGGRKSEIAAEAVLFLCKQFENLDINIGVIGYGSHTYVHKELTTKKFNYDELYTQLTDSMGGTDDAPALRRAYHMFRSAPEGENILIHLSDGSPGSNYGGQMHYYGVDGKKEKLNIDPPFKEPKWDGSDNGSINYNEKEHLHHLVKSHPEVMAFGIGIMAGGWQIPEHFVIQKATDLKPQMLSILRRNIKRG